MAITQLNKLATPSSRASDLDYSFTGANAKMRLGFSTSMV